MTDAPRAGGEQVTDQSTDLPTEAAVPSYDAGVAHLPAPGETVRHPWLKVVRDQRKAAYLALGFIVASLWIVGQLGRWPLAICIAGGVLLGLANHLATERWLLKTITSGHSATRNQMIGATLVRLAVLSVVAIGAAVAFWPDGIGLLLGLAIFRLVALLMTSITLLKELKSDA